MSVLPDRPSELIRVALDDLEKCEADPRYETHMYSWHDPHDGKCLVCMAGAVMAKRLGAPPALSLAPYSYDFQTARKLRAIDYGRCGLLDEMLFQLNIERPKELPSYIDVAYYDDDPAAFKSDMRKLAELLEAHGL